MLDEVYRRLVASNGAERTDRAHFFALASRAMRFILVDYARARLERSRGAPADIPADAVQAERVGGPPCGRRRTCPSHSD